MMIQIAVTETTTGRYYTLSAEKTSMSIGVTRHYVTTLVDNAAARAYRGPGKTFHGADALSKAAAAYKSATCKAMIEAVQAAERALVAAAAADA